MLQKMLGFILLLVFSLNVYARHTNKRLMACDITTLKIYPLAVDYPGMSKSHTLYGIVNSSKSACKVYSNLDIWGITESGVSIKLTPKATRLKKKLIVLKPASNLDYIYSSRLVWFSLSGTSAGETVFPKVKLGLDQESDFVIFDYIGNNTDIKMDNQVHKGNLVKWFKYSIAGDSCSYSESASKGMNKVFIQKGHKSSKVYFKSLAQCG